MARWTAMIVLGCAVWGCTKDTTNLYLTEAVSRGTVSEDISATGEVSARIKVNVGSQVSGTIARLYADFNQAVHKGDLLAELDPRLFVAQLGRVDASVAVAEAQIERARVTLMDAERNLRRVAELAGKKMVAQADLDAAEVQRAAAQADIKAAEAGRLQARADRDLAATNLAFTKIRSPLDGTVIDRQVDVGQTVAASFQVATLFVIAEDLRHVQILASIDEADVGKVNAGMAVRFTVDAYPQTTFEGTIRAVRQAPIAPPGGAGAAAQAQPQGNVVTYAAVVEADNPDYKLRQGMTAQVTVRIHERRDVLRLPNAALRFRLKAPVKADAQASAPPPPAQGWTRVYTLQGTVPDTRDVRLGLNDGHHTEVLEGMHEGDLVVVAEAPHAQGPRRGLF